MTVSLRLNQSEAQLVKSYAELHGLSLSELFRTSVIEHIEDDCDLEAFEAAYTAYQADPVTYTLDEVEKELGLA